LKLSDNEIDKAFTSTAVVCPPLFHAVRSPLGILPDRITDSRSTKAVNVHLFARVYPDEYGRREIVPPAEPERKPMVIKYVFETAGKTLQELTNFPISGDLTPPAEPTKQAAPVAPVARRCPIVAISARVIGWTDVTDGADPEEADLAWRRTSA
jgi:hypothetical protein